MRKEQRQMTEEYSVVSKFPDWTGGTGGTGGTGTTLEFTELSFFDITASQSEVQDCSASPRFCDV